MFKIHLTFVLLFLLAQHAFAHYPVMECFKKEATISCDVGFSDGTKAKGKEVRLINYDEEVIAVQEADKFSRVSFDVPEGEYYIFFDAKHEFPIEVDYGEL